LAPKTGDSAWDTNSPSPATMVEHRQAWTPPCGNQACVSSRSSTEALGSPDGVRVCSLNLVSGLVARPAQVLKASGAIVVTSVSMNSRASGVSTASGQRGDGKREVGRARGTARTEGALWLSRPHHLDGLPARARADGGRERRRHRAGPRAQTGRVAVHAADGAGCDVLRVLASGERNSARASSRRCTAMGDPYWRWVETPR
jgi:hypothetical protein